VKPTHLAGFAALLSLAALPARAQPPSPSAVGEAQSHFKRGVELYEDSDLQAALVEFRRAYDLVPNYRVLYNLGRVASALHDYASALHHYRQYLAEGGLQVPVTRRLEVEGELQKLSARVGQLRVIVDMAGTEIAVDDVSVGISPLREPVLVNAGQRRVVVIAPGVPPVARLVEVAGEETVTVTIAVPLPRATPRPPELVDPLPPPRPVQQKAPPPHRALPRRTWPTVVSWTATGLLAAGTGAAGFLALRDSRDLHDLRESYPVSYDDLTAAQRRTRTSALVADGLLAGTVIMAAVSLYVTLSGPSETTVAVGPGSVALEGRF
jgi:hypothetical protein